MDCKVYGRTIRAGQYVFVTWSGVVLTEGPKPSEAGTLYLCAKTGRLVKAEEVVEDANQSSE